MFDDVFQVNYVCRIGVSRIYVKGFVHDITVFAAPFPWQWELPVNMNILNWEHELLINVAKKKIIQPFIKSGWSLEK